MRSGRSDGMSDADPIGDCVGPLPMRGAGPASRHMVPFSPTSVPVPPPTASAHYVRSCSVTSPRPA